MDNKAEAIGIMETFWASEKEVGFRILLNGCGRKLAIDKLDKVSMANREFASSVLHGL